jgi:hypothetical protein
MNNHNNTVTKAVHCSMKVLQSVNTFIDEHLSAVPISGRERYKEITPDVNTSPHGTTVTPASSRYFDATTPAGAQLQTTLSLLQQQGSLPSALPRVICPNCGYCTAIPVQAKKDVDEALTTKPSKLPPQLAASYLDIDSDKQVDDNDTPSSTSSSAASSIGNVRGQHLLCAVPGLVCRVSEEHLSSPPIPKLLYCGMVGVVIKVSGARVKLQFFQDGIGADDNKMLGSKTWWYHRTELVLLALSVEKYDGHSTTMTGVTTQQKLHQHTEETTSYSPESPFKTTPVTATVSAYSPCSIGVAGGFSPELYRDGNTEQQFVPAVPCFSSTSAPQFPTISVSHQQQCTIPPSQPAVLLVGEATLNNTIMGSSPMSGASDELRDRYNSTPAYKDVILHPIPTTNANPAQHRNNHHRRTGGSEGDYSGDGGRRGAGIASPLSPFPQLVMTGPAGTVRPSGESQRRGVFMESEEKDDGVGSPSGRGVVTSYDIVSVGTSLMDSIEEINVLDHVNDDDSPSDPFRQVVMGASTPNGTPRSNGFVSGVTLGHSGRSMSITTAVADGLVVGGSAARSLRRQLRANSVVYDSISEGGGGGFPGGGSGVSPSSNRESSRENSRRSPQPAWI